MTGKLLSSVAFVSIMFTAGTAESSVAPQALTLERLKAQSVSFLEDSSNADIAVHELKTTAAAGDVSVRIDGKTYYFTPVYAENASALQTLADIGSVALKKLTDSTGAIYSLKIDGETVYYGYDKDAFPTSGYSLSEISKDEAENASYPVVTKYTRNADNTVTKTYYKVNIPEIGSGNKTKYYKWAKDGEGHLTLVDADASTADIIAKYGENSYSKTFENLSKEYSITDPSLLDTYAYGGAAVYNDTGTNYGDINDTLFSRNHFDGTLILSIKSNRYLYLYGGAISNRGTIGNIIADFIGNYVAGTSEGRYGNYARISAYGGAIYNDENSTIGNITGDFINNYAQSTYSSARGGAIYNYYKSTIGNITGDFINNYAKSTGGNSSARGGAIYNYSSRIGNITGDFINNYAQATYYYSYGGAIYNEGKIGNITGDFIGNYAQSTGTSSSSDVDGGAIYNEGKIGNITGDFIGNYARASAYNALGGAIYNDFSATTGNITGDFINNYAQGTTARGGAIYNHNKSTIGNITGDFSGNYAQGIYAYGGAIYNDYYYSTIGNITGDFIGNYVQATGTNSYLLAYGGAIYNDGYDSPTTIGNITGDFIGNYAKSTGTSSYSYVFGGAIYNYKSTIGNITGDFIGNYAKSTDTSSSSKAYGGAIYNGKTIGNIVNSSFIGNYVSGNEDSAGGAVYSTADLSITADNGASLFDGNYVEKNGVKTSNAVYMVGAEDAAVGLNLSAVNNGTITFNDGINGTNYNINVTGDSTGVVKFNNLVENVNNFNLSSGSITHLGLNGVINVQNMTAETGSTLVGRQSTSASPIITVDVEVDKAANKVNSGAINVAEDVSGDYRVLVNALNPDVLDNKDDAIVPFLFAPNDQEGTASSFSVARVIGSPYLWDTALNLKNEKNGSTWYLNLTDILNPDYKPEEPENPDNDKPSKPVVRPVAPEVIAGMGLHEAAIEQTRSLVRNVRNKVAAGREYCPNCGVYSAEWDGEKLRNGWVLAQGETATIDKPVKMDADIWGVEAGFDVQNDVNNTLGVFASYRKGEYDLNGKADKLRSTIGSEIDIDSYLAGLYYRYDKNMNWLFATVYGGVQQADAKTDDKIAKFDTDGIEFGASIEAGHTFALSNDLTLDPSLGLYYTQVNFDDAKDNLGKEYSWKDVKHLEAELGAKLEKQIDAAKVYVKPSVIQTITSGDSVKITGLNKLSTYDDQTLGRIELGGRYGFTDALSAYGWVNYTFGSDYDATAFGAGVSYSW
ncbi:MAG: autotransporter outer membrane beta-barrel domain-containing protein [Azospirillum sp.]|nr:autotransporter outer membrane beta-barrel domain-containing protein [Azospirillum sp.]